MGHLPYVDLVAFTAIVLGSISAGTAIYSLQSGQSIIVGNLIYCTGSLTWTAHTGVGNLLIGNFPFTVRNLANFDPEFIVRTESIAWPSGTGFLFGEWQTGKNYAQIVECRSNQLELIIPISVAGTIHFTGSYLR